MIEVLYFILVTVPRLSVRKSIFSRRNVYTRSRPDTSGPVPMPPQFRVNKHNIMYKIRMTS